MNKFRKQSNQFMKRVQSSYRATISPVDKQVLECELANLLKNAYILGQNSSAEKAKEVNNDSSCN